MLSTKCLQIIFYVYKDDLVLNNQQQLICYKTQPNQTNTWNHLTVCNQMSSGLFKNSIAYKQLGYKSYI